MSMTDPIADTLTRIRNALLAQHETLEVPHSRMREALVRILSEEGYVGAWALNEKEPPFKTISVELKYRSDRAPAIEKMQRISNPGRRVYVGKDEIPSVLHGMGINILSTSQGVFTGKKARELGIGGELLCEVY